jgi:hypothetical protein
MDTKSDTGELTETYEVHYTTPDGVRWSEPCWTKADALHVASERRAEGGRFDVVVYLIPTDGGDPVQLSDA